MKRKLLNIYFTAGYPKLDSTIEILKTLDEAEVDFIEVGIPYSDPLADGPTIQESSHRALKNGINIETIFGQLRRYKCSFSELIIMAYYNSVLTFGMGRFLKECKEAGIKSLIIPDLPLEEYQVRHQADFLRYGVSPVFLVSPSTETERIELLANNSQPFLYVVSSSSTTGTSSKLEIDREFFENLNALDLPVPCLTGFNISDKESFERATKFTDGGIIGSAFIRCIGAQGNLKSNIQTFISNFKS